MAEEEDRSSKTEAPSQKRLEDARKKGDVAKSMEVGATFSLATGAMVVALAGAPIARGAADALTPFLAHPDAFDLSNSGGALVMRQALQAAWPAAMVMAAAAAAGAAGNLLQTGFMWAPSKLAPDFKKVNPFEGLKRLLGIDAFVNFLKALAKLIAVGACAWVVIAPHLTEFSRYGALDVAAILPVSAELLRGLAFAVLMLMGTIAGADWFWTRQRFMARMRMSREDLKQEHKDSDGDPHVKAKQKRLRAERAKKRMMAAVPTATVVVMNPTHFAVALKYVQGEDAAPLCVAKGVDSLALKIRAVAEEAGVPVIEDAPLARALHAAIDVDDIIPREHYEAVAKVIGFVLGKSRRAAPRRIAP